MYSKYIENLGIRSETMDKKMMAMSTSMLILKLLEEEDLYGYLMIRRLEERSNQVFSLKEGTLYPILHTLEEQEAVESYEKAAETGRIRKYYRLTKKGQKLLKEKQKEWETYEKAVRNVMKGGVSFAL
jgi:PadR family transcriptional regulator PadR